MPQSIDKITVRGFKSIRSLDDFELRALNVLIGPNGAGKTNFVTFFSFLRQLVDQNLQAEVRDHGDADSLLHLGPKVTQFIKASLRFGQNSYEFTLRRSREGTLYFTDERAGYHGQTDKWIPLGRGHAESKLKDKNDLPNLWGGTPGITGYTLDSILSWTTYHFHDTGPEARVRARWTVRDYEALRTDASNLAAFLYHVQRTNANTYSLIRETVRLAAPFFDDFLLRPEQINGDEKVLLEWRQRGTDYPFHPSQLSDGTLRFMCLATALLQPDPPATILIDEPELGLHPFALTLLADLMRRAAARTQVIVSTQSAYLLDQLDPEHVIVVEQHEGASTFKRLDPGRLADWLKEYTLSELWDKNVLGGRP